MKPKIKVAFASGTDELNALLIDRMRRVFPELPFYVVSEFPPVGADFRWVRYRGGFMENLARCRRTFSGKSIRLAGVLLVPDVPFRRMRLLALILAPFYFLAVNENLNDFMLRPGSFTAIARHIGWRVGNFVRWHIGRNGALARLSWRDVAFLLAIGSGWLRFRLRPSQESRKAESPQSQTPFCEAGEIGEFPEQFHYSLFGDGDSHYCGEKMRLLGGPDTTYESPEVRSLDLCYRAWQRGWPTVSAFRSVGAIPGTSLDYLKFLARSISDPGVFRQRWKQALDNAKDRSVLWRAPLIALGGGARSSFGMSDDMIFCLTDGTVAVYAGKSATDKPRVLVISAYIPFPLSHGGAVRMHNLTSRASAAWDQILICFVETDAPPPLELLARFVEVVLVRRTGSHFSSASGNPEVVEQFRFAAFRGAIRMAMAKWKPGIAQLEFTQMAQYARDCAPARTILVEHDITFDLYQQLAKNDSDWDLQREVKLWRRFEIAAWREMACVVTMSAKDHVSIEGTRSVALPNGVDLARFCVSAKESEPERLLFVGSFSHLPNIMALAFFLDGAWAPLREAAPNAQLHVIAGANHEYFLEYQSQRVRLNLDQPGIEVEGFVSDVRPAYERATVVIAPLVASAGTNLKILEAMACGRPVVSTAAGVNGLDLIPGEEFVLVHSAAAMAQAIARLLGSPEECKRLAAAGRRRVEESYDWDAIAARQMTLYQELWPTSL